MTTPLRSIPEWAANQATPNVTVNAGIRRLEAGALYFGEVIDKDTTAQPGSPSNGDVYIIGSSATGDDWSGNDGKIAIYNSGWSIETPAEGWLAYLQDENKLYVYGGSSWAELSVASGGLTLASTVTQSGTPVATSVGFLGSPQISDQDDYTLALTDSGGHYYHVSGTPHTLTIPANSSVAFPVGTVIAIVNENDGGDITLAITSDTLRWTDQTGSRTIAANGTATLLKVTSTVWRLTGDGIT